MPDPSPTEKILDAAQRLFLRNGIHATGVDDIIAEAGTARMTLYNRFGSKEGLVTAFLEREGETWRRWFEQELAQRGPTASERLLAVFDVLETWFAQEDFYGCAFINAVAESCKDNDQPRALALAHKRQVLGTIERLALAAGFDDPPALAHQIGLLMDGAIVAALVTRDPKVARNARALAEALVASRRVSA